MAGNPRTAAIRAWALENGFASVSERGRIPGHIISAYEDEFGPETPVEQPAADDGVEIDAAALLEQIGQLRDGDLVQIKYVTEREGLDDTDVHLISEAYHVAGVAHVAGIPLVNEDGAIVISELVVIKATPPLYETGDQVTVTAIVNSGPNGGRWELFLPTSQECIFAHEADMQPREQTEDAAGDES